MKLFLHKLFIFFSFPILFILLIEVSISLFKKDIESEKKLEKVFAQVGNNYNWIKKVKPNKKILLLGSSSVRYGLSCSKLNELSNDTLSFINLGMDARDPVEMYFLLKQIDLTDVKSVYLGLDPWIFTKRYYKHINPYLYLDMNFFTAYKYWIEHDRSIFLKRYKSFLKYLFPSENSYHEINQEVPIDYGSIKLTNKPKNFNSPINEFFQIDKYGWSELQFLYLTKIVSLCKTRNIYFSAFIPPKRSDYSDTYKSKCSLIHKEYVNNLVNANFSAPIFGKFNQLDTIGDYDFFQEAYHLNSHGQEVYSVLFYDMILNKKEIFSSKYSWFN
jgi:hypothetical protein